MKLTMTTIKRMEVNTTFKCLLLMFYRLLDLLKTVNLLYIIIICL